MRREAVSPKRFAEDMFDDLSTTDEPSLACSEFYELLKKKIRVN